VLVVILLLLRYTRGFVQNISVLLGIICGYAVTIVLGWPNFSGLEAQPWFAVIYPFQFGLPKFDIVAGLSMCLVMVVVMIESTGMFLALGDIVERPVTPADLTRGLRADGLGTLIGGTFNTFPYTSFSQNVGLVGVTGIRSRFVCVFGGLIMLALGMVPKIAFVVATVPQCVLGGAGVVMFGMVAATGIKILSGVNYATQRNNLFVVAISIGFGMIPLVAPTLFKSFPEFLKPVLDSGILLATVAAVALNAFFNRVVSTEQAKADAMASAHASEAI
jgi:NCS2 family nucleobase:cation symporter-2